MVRSRVNPPKYEGFSKWSTYKRRRACCPASYSSPSCSSRPSRQGWPSSCHFSPGLSGVAHFYSKKISDDSTAPAYWASSPHFHPEHLPPFSAPPPPSSCLVQPESRKNAAFINLTQFRYPSCIIFGLVVQLSPPAAHVARSWPCQWRASSWNSASSPTPLDPPWSCRRRGCLGRTCIIFEE